MHISDSAVNTCSSEWYVQVVNKSNSPIQTPSIVTPKYVIQRIFIYIVTCRVVRLTYKTGSGKYDWIY
jgi:hypothetical protein